MTLRSHIAGRLLAAAMCMPVVGGSALSPLLDAIVYPHGACCCERAHGRAHHCVCMTPHEEGDAAKAHAASACPDQLDEGGTEYGIPPPQSLPPAVLASTSKDSFLFTVPVRSFSDRSMASRSLPPPPTPPPELT